jgi:hypothetical protein
MHTRTHTHINTHTHLYVCMSVYICLYIGVRKTRRTATVTMAARIGRRPHLALVCINAYHPLLDVDIDVDIHRYIDK